MKTHYSLLLMVVACSLTNCGSRTGADGKTGTNADTIHPGPATEIRLRSENIEKTGNLSDLFEIHQYIPLETSEASLIGEISKLIVSGGRFWIMDRVTESVFQFTDQGKHLSRIARKGKGAGEYRTLTDFTVCGDTVYVWDGMQRKMLTYSASGEIIRETQATFMAARL